MTDTLILSPFYQRSPEGDAILHAAIDFAARTDAEDVTHQFLATLRNNPHLAALYARVRERGNLHQEVGRQMRFYRRAEAGYRVKVDGSVHGSYTRLPRRRG